MSCAPVFVEMPQVLQFLIHCLLTIPGIAMKSVNTFQKCINGLDVCTYLVLPSYGEHHSKKALNIQSTATARSDICKISGMIPRLSEMTPPITRKNNCQQKNIQAGPTFEFENFLCACIYAGKMLQRSKPAIRVMGVLP